MLTEEQLGKLKTFNVGAMGEKARELCHDPSYDGLTFEEKLALMIDAQEESRSARKLRELQRAASLKDQGACVEEVVWLPERKLPKDRIERLAACGWVDAHGVVVLTSATGCGKSYIAQALANAAIRRKHTVRYARMAGILEELERARSTGTIDYYDALDALKRVDLLVIDDFMTTPVSSRDTVDILEIAEGRDGRRATLVCSQFETHEWYLRIGDKVIADATLNRLVTGATCIRIEGPNMRKWLAEHPDRLHG